MHTKLLIASASAALIINLGLASLASADVIVGGGGVPQTSEDCYNYGWENLTDILGVSFKNQGDCVSYVSTSGRNLADGTNLPVGDWTN